MTASLVPGRQVLFGQLGLFGFALAAVLLRYMASAGSLAGSPDAGVHIPASVEQTHNARLTQTVINPPAP